MSLQGHHRSGRVRRKIDAKRWLLNLQRGFLQTQFSKYLIYLQEHVVVGLNSSCCDIHWIKCTCWNTCFCLVLLKQDKRSESMVRRRTEWVSKLSSVDMFYCDSRVCTVIKFFLIGLKPRLYFHHAVSYRLKQWCGQFGSKYRSCSIWTLKRFKLSYKSNAAKLSWLVYFEQLKPFQ